MALALAIFWAIFARDVATDLPLHADMTLNALRTGVWPGNFLFYVLDATVAGFAEDQRALRAASAVILACAVGAKYVLSWQFVNRETYKAGPSLSPLVLVAVLVPLMFVFSVPTDKVYLGQLPPTIWHNSTTILLMPFAVVMFTAGLAFARSGERRWLYWAGLAGGLAIATKPTFSIAFGIAFPLFVLLERRRFAPALAALGVSVGLAALVLAQYFYIYNSDTGSADGVALRPLHVWEFYSQNIGLSLLASFVFPLVGIVVLRGRLLRYPGFRFASLLTLTSLLMFIFVGETGPREYDGNFVWQVYVAMFLVFLSVSVVALTDWRKRLSRTSGALLLSAFSIHFVSGLWFLYYMFDHGGFI